VSRCHGCVHGLPFVQHRTGAATYFRSVGGRLCESPDQVESRWHFQTAALARFAESDIVRKMFPSDLLTYVSTLATSTTLVTEEFVDALIALAYVMQDDTGFTKVLHEYVDDARRQWAREKVEREAGIRRPLPRL